MKPWRLEDEKTLGTHPDAQIALLLDRSSACVVQHRRKLGIGTFYQRQPRQEHELALIGVRSDDEIAHLTGHSIKSVRFKRQELKLEVGRDIPTVLEIKRMTDAAKSDRTKALVLTMALTGLRASELRGLRWSDVDLKAAELNVMQRADRYNDMGAPKSGSSVRSVPLAPEALAALKVWKLQCPAGDLVFPTATGKPDHHKNMDRKLKALMLAAKVVDAEGEPKYAAHAFRHFFASWCINSRSRGGRELPPKEVQTLLGHSSIVMTLDIYGHLFPRGDDKGELARASAALFA